MLILEISTDSEMWDEEKEEFINIKPIKLRFEHSLVSISKWEMKYHKPFLSPNKNDEKTSEEILDYIKFMLLDDIDPGICDFLRTEHIKQIDEYINNPMTATTFSNNSGKKSNEIVTSELIYFWMISYQIPVEFENWHINRLMTLIRVCSIKNNPPKNMSTGELMKRNAALNAARRSKYRTTG